jgi:DNA-binding transcriptional LysR family regulator
LVFRNTRHFKPTEAGLHFYELCKNPLFEIRHAAEVVKSNETDVKGKLSVTMALDMAHAIMPPLISEFAKTYPNLDLDIRGEDRIVDLVKEGVDVAIRAGHLSDSNLKALKISDISLILVANPAYLTSQSKIRTIEQLKDHRLVLFNKKFEKNFSFNKRGGRKQKLKISSSLLVNNPLMAKSFALLGQGVALVPDLICYEELKSGSLVRVLPEMSAESSSLHFVWPAHASESPKVRAFINFMKDHMRKYFLAGQS